MDRTPHPVDEPVMARVRGELRLSRFGSSGPADADVVDHRTEFVPGQGYSGMEDNDIRGFLDGAFAYGWNQVHQQHVRVGRGAWHRPAPRYGEPEIFRCLQRWTGIDLPPDAEVHDASISLTVERPPERRVTLFLYAVRKDWNPGRGGEREDNTSPPAEGEVWWRAPAAGRREWALPGAGHASDHDPDADTPSMPLAEATCSPGTRSLELSSPRLANYVADRIARDLPCLFLLKLADPDEDTPGTVIDIYSAEHGDTMNPSRRPRLRIGWRSAPVEAREHSILLERGRTLAVGTFECDPGDWFAASFTAAEGSPAPRVEVRDSGDPDSGGWRAVHHPFRVAGRELEMRVRAVRFPVSLGKPFEATVRDTWVTSGPPDSREVVWRFRAPSGMTRDLPATYEGDYTWRVRFEPDEPGRWRYTWNHDFTPDPYDPAWGEFDVVVEDELPLVEALRAFESEVAGEATGEDPSVREQFGRKLLALERGALRTISPEGWRGPRGREVRARIRRIRSELWGRTVPDPLPLEAHDRSWRERSTGEGGSRDGRGGGVGALRRILRRGVRALKRRILR